jgi:hypothetical protein
MSELIKEYKVAPDNSTVCGYPSKYFDWGKFDWKGETYHSQDLQKLFRGLKVNIDSKAPKPWIDHSSQLYYDYLHVPYEWAEHGTIYRVRPKYKAGNKRGKRIITKVQAIEKLDGWYWVVTYK